MTKRPSPLPDDVYIHRLVRLIHEDVMGLNVTYEDLSNKSGIGANTIRKWRKNDSSPKLVDIEAVLQALGYQLVAVKTGKI